MRQIQKYCKHRSEETPTTPNLALIEFNAGQQISNLFQLRQELLSTCHQTQHNIRLYFSDNQKVPFHL